MEKSYLEKIQIHKENKLAGLHPGAKLWVVILYTVCTFILNSIHLTEVGLSLAVIPWFLVVLILCATSGAMKKCVKAFKAVAFIALVIFVVQTFIVPVSYTHLQEQITLFWIQLQMQDWMNISDLRRKTLIKS